MGYECQLHDGQANATIIVTWLANGATLSVCPDCFAPGMINVLAVDLGVDPTKFYDHVKRFVDKAARDAAKEVQQATDAATTADGGAGVGEVTVICGICQEQIPAGEVHDHGQADPAEVTG